MNYHFCPDCGSKLPEDTTFCRACGRDLTQASQAVEQDHSQTSFLNQRYNDDSAAVSTDLSDAEKAEKSRFDTSETTLLADCNPGIDESMSEEVPETDLLEPSAEPTTVPPVPTNVRSGSSPTNVAGTEQHQSKTGFEPTQFNPGMSSQPSGNFFKGQGQGGGSFIPPAPGTYHGGPMYQQQTGPLRPVMGQTTHVQRSQSEWPPRRRPAAVSEQPGGSSGSPASGGMYGGPDRGAASLDRTAEGSSGSPPPPYFQQSQQYQALQQPVQPQKKKKAFLKPLIIIIVILLIAAAAFAAWYFFLKKDSAKADGAFTEAYVIDQLEDQLVLKNKLISPLEQGVSDESTESYLSVLRLIKWNRPWDLTVSELTAYFGKRPIIQTDRSSGYDVMTIQYDHVKLADQELNFTLLSVENVTVGYWFEYDELDKFAAIEELEACFGPPQLSYAWYNSEEDTDGVYGIGSWSTIVVIVDEDHGTVSFYFNDFFQDLDAETYGLLK
ncbi:MAG TPA: zinc-ribbon domain-containing protein [Clostridiaceae bacterium]|nr:zinc-ribbon domain-containing protein [Clostridiaceae bacterium]